jgi:hypothetical protein
MSVIYLAKITSELNCNLCSYCTLSSFDNKKRESQIVSWLDVKELLWQTDMLERRKQGTLWSQVWWFTSVIPATQEREVGGPRSQDWAKTLSKKQKDWGVTQVVESMHEALSSMPSATKNPNLCEISDVESDSYFLVELCSTGNREALEHDS